MWVVGSSARSYSAFADAFCVPQGVPELVSAVSNAGGLGKPARSQGNEEVLRGIEEGVEGGLESRKRLLTSRNCELQVFSPVLRLDLPKLFELRSARLRR